MEKVFNTILQTIKNEGVCATATVVSQYGSTPAKVGAKILVFGDGRIQGSIGGGAFERRVIIDAQAAIKRKKSSLKSYSLDSKSAHQACGGKVSVFIEVIEPLKRLVIFGAGHIGLALSMIAKLINFSVTVVDNRRTFANKARFPHADEVIHGPYKRSFKKIRADRNTFMVIVTHGHLYDGECLEAALRSEARYIGMIGSRKKIGEVMSRLLKKGFQKKRLRDVYTPIGLDIGAQTAQEIALAIAAEMVLAARGSKTRRSDVSGCCKTDGA